MIALDAVDHLVSPFGPEQTCVELKVHKSIRKVMCPIFVAFL
jgi:hypothetical protein